jgi:hypothetical protein
VKRTYTLKEIAMEILVLLAVVALMALLVVRSSQAQRVMVRVPARVSRQRVVRRR